MFRHIKHDKRITMCFMITLLACLRLRVQAACKRTEQLIAHERGVATLRI